MLYFLRLCLIDFDVILFLLSFFDILAIKFANSIWLSLLKEKPLILSLTISLAQPHPLDTIHGVPISNDSFATSPQVS